MAVLKRILAAATLAGAVSALPLVKKGDFEFVATVPSGDTVFTVDDISYLALTSTPVLSVTSTDATTTGSIVPFTVVTTGDCYVSADFVSSTVQSFAEWDDVYSLGFLEGVYISSNCTGATIDPAVFTWAEGANVTSLFVSSTFGSVDTGKTSYTVSSIYQPTPIECGPYAVAITEGGAASFSQVYRLYEDHQRTFIMGVYPAIGSFKGLPQYLTKFQDEMIPVPSRIYSWSDTRPFAGLRVAVKDLYDLNGVQTSGGSRSWATITPEANITAPAIQRVIDLGGHIVGKFKTAQFASGANPWDFIDTQAPFNPRGDGYLTCDCSSAGGGCSMASYDWLDHAIGSDTSWSMRRPASVSGTYGNRPSQGMITLDHVLPLGATQDTAGVFARTPSAWAHFAKNWYSPTLHQDSSITGLTEPLVINDTYKWPAKVYYPTDMFTPVRNPAADALIQAFLANLTSLGIQRVDMNITDMVLKAPVAKVSNITGWRAASSLLITNTAYWVIGKPLVTAWAAMFGGRYPPLDPNHTSWYHFNESTISDDKVAAAIGVKQAFSDWVNYDFLGADDETCSGALWVYDIGSGGLPSYRYQQLITTAGPAATNMSYTPPTAKFTGSSVCSFAGCPDYTVPIGQVPYFSNVTFFTEMVPVTINVVARRGCDFMLFNLFAEMESRGMLATIKTGRTAF